MFEGPIELPVGQGAHEEPHFGSKRLNRTKGSIKLLLITVIAFTQSALDLFGMLEDFVHHHILS